MSKDKYTIVMRKSIFDMKKKPIVALKIEVIVITGPGINNQ